MYGGGRVASAEVADAWNDLHAHPALQWVPPMWRTARPTTAPSQHAIHAIEVNLVVAVESANSAVKVRLATGPLHDKVLSDGVDPVTPTIHTDPNLCVSAATFEEALVELRDVLIHNYGPVNDPRAHAPKDAETLRPIGRIHSVR
ncbi:hypothetical protein [Nocardioides sp. LML1-1-1.1]|uniref:hypothetical protein n=1 Tax=Nocardioides sp. LML1-1-1.1 TaxID=3135248 RepID=UPI003441CCB0